MEQYTKNSFYLIRIFLKWKTHFIVVTLAAILLSVLLSSEWFIKPRYKSFATVYPANVIPFSEESKTEQILQILQSSQIKDSIVKKFNLWSHYGIEPTEKEANAKLNGTYQNFVSISKTEFESVDIKVTDTDPKLACDIANEIISQLNFKISSLHKEKAMEVADVLKKQLKNQERELDSLNKALEEMSIKYQLLDYKSQSKEVSKAFIKGANATTTTLMKNLGEKGVEYEQLNKTQNNLIQIHNRTKTDYDNILKELNKSFTYTYIVSPPNVPDKKSYPIRWLIVTVSVISADLLLLVFILLLNNKNLLNQA